MCVIYKQFELFRPWCLFFKSTLSPPCPVEFVVQIDLYFLLLSLVFSSTYTHSHVHVLGSESSVACQSPVVQLESWCFNSVQAGRQGEKKHSPHGQIGSAQHLTDGGTYTGWCQWARRRGRGTRCKQSKHRSRCSLFWLEIWISELNEHVGVNTYFSSVMMSLWPVYCSARRSARSLASELKVRGARVTLSYSVTTKHTGEAVSTSVTVWCFTSHYEGI